MASLVVAGLLDLWWMLVLAVALGLSLRGSTTNAAVLRSLTVLAALGVVGIPVVGVLSRRLPARFVDRIGGAPAVGALIRRVMEELRRQTWSRRLLAGAGFSGLALVCRYGFQLYLLDAMFGGVTWTQGLFALVFAGLANLAPIQGVGNVGSIELPWAWALVLVGVGKADAIASGFALHGVVLAYALGTGALSVALLRTRSAQVVLTRAALRATSRRTMDVMASSQPWTPLPRPYVLSPARCPSSAPDRHPARATGLPRHPTASMNAATREPRVPAVIGARARAPLRNI